jgi:hypothetical protein
VDHTATHSEAARRHPLAKSPSATGEEVAGRKRQALKMAFSRVGDRQYEWPAGRNSAADER